MKITQAYESTPMVKFRFRQRFGLKSPRNTTKPLVVFGLYHKKDVKYIKQYHGPVVIVWMGKDSLKTPTDRLMGSRFIHTTWLPHVQQHLINKGVDCKLLRIPLVEPYAPLLTLGNEVYTYLQKGKPEYHGAEVVDELNLRFPIFVGDHSIPRHMWYNGACNDVYRRCFVGLMLSGYAGGGMSIVEMGMRGIPVVTNVLNLPHCIPWESVADIENEVEKVAYYIGMTRPDIQEQVRESLVPVDRVFDLNKLLYE